MAIGVVSDIELERELSNVTAARVEELRRGRGNGKLNTPDALRKVIGEEAVKNGHAAGLALAGEFGISESSVSAYQEGSTSTALMDRPDPLLLDHINKAKQEVARKAQAKLVLAIDSITESKLEEASPRIAAGVAKDMSAVVKNMEPASEQERNATQFVFFVPPMKKEEAFDIIDVKE